MPAPIGVVVNGRPTSLPAGTTVATLVDGLHRSPGGIAVAIGGEVVPRSAWAGWSLGDGDRIELLGAVQGG